MSRPTTQRLHVLLLYPFICIFASHAVYRVKHLQPLNPNSTTGTYRQRTLHEWTYSTFLWLYKLFVTVKLRKGHYCSWVNRTVSILIFTLGETQDFDLRLVNNYFFGDPKPKEGRLEIYYSGTWGSICDDGFTNVSASVACAKLGYG